jgi:hypothetical protein
MRKTPHSESLFGYFDELRYVNVVEFQNLLLEIMASPASFFSVVNTSYSSFGFQINTEQLTLSSEQDSAAELGDFVEALGQEWQQAVVTVRHGTRTPNLGLKLIGAHQNEELSAAFDNLHGVCELTALFREGYDTRAYLLRLAAALSLAEKSKKASRYIPESLEIKLLCDSMHLCNVCREAGVIIHHIVPIEASGLSEEENLIVLCLNHHNGAHSKSTLAKNLRPEHLREYKRRHLLWVTGRGASTAALEIVPDL